MSCKKGCFIATRKNDVRDLTDNLLTTICTNVDIEPKLLPLTGDVLDYQTANMSNETKQKLIFEKEDSGTGANRHFLT